MVRLVLSGGMSRSRCCLSLYYLKSRSLLRNRKRRRNRRLMALLVRVGALKRGTQLTLDACLGEEPIRCCIVGRTTTGATRHGPPE
jgi:hypothetical protein